MLEGETWECHPRRDLGAYTLRPVNRASASGRVEGCDFTHVKSLARHVELNESLCGTHDRRCIHELLVRPQGPRHRSVGVRRLESVAALASGRVQMGRAGAPRL